MEVQLDFGQARFKELRACLHFEFKEQLSGEILKPGKNKSIVLVGFHNAKGCGFVFSAKAQNEFLL